MDFLDSNYDPQLSAAASMSNKSHSHHFYGPGEPKDGETELSERRISMANHSSMNLPYPNSNPAANPGSSFLLPSYANSGYFQADFDPSGGNGHSESFTMPRTVNWSDATPMKQTAGDFGRIHHNEASNMSVDVTAPPSALMSAKGYSDRTKNSSFNTSFEAAANPKADHAFCYGDAIRSSEANGPDSNVIESLNLKLQIKETQNESLENEIQKLRSVFNEALDFKQSESKFERQNSHTDSASIEVPTSVEQVFKKMSTSLKKKDEELEETKQTLESVLTALALNPTNSVTKYGRYDAEALAHKMVVRLETLTKENQEMAKMLAYGRAKEVQIELQLARMENRELRDTISEFNQPDDSPRT